MDNSFWHNKWTQGEIGFHQQAFHPLLTAFFHQVNARANSTVFVPLCGKSLDMLWLRGEGHPVLGVELSPLAVAAFFADNGLVPSQRQDGDFQRFSCDGIDLLCGDFFRLTPQQLAHVGAVYDRAALVALPAEMRADYARHLLAILPAGTPMLIVTFDYPQHEKAGPPFSVSGNEINALFGDRYDVTLVKSFDLLNDGAENDPLRQSGVSRLEEKVYVLTEKS
jgi:thiopurine S-methyltransferase